MKFMSMIRVASATLLFVFGVLNQNISMAQTDGLVIHLSAENDYRELPADPQYTDLAGGNTVMAYGSVPIMTTAWNAKSDNYKYSYKFNGESYLAIEDPNQNLNFQGSFTIIFIAAPTEYSNGMIISKGSEDGSLMNFKLGFGAEMPHTGYWYGAGGSTFGGGYTGDPEINIWERHIFIVNNNIVDYWIGNELVSSGEIPELQQLFSANANADPLRIGFGASTAPNQWGPQYFTGEIADIKVFNRALDLSEIEAFDYNGTCVDDPEPPNKPFLTAFNEGISLKWGHNTKQDFNRYQVQMSDDGNTYTDFGASDLHIPAITFPGLTNGNTYYFRIKSIDNLGRMSLPSEVVSGTPEASKNGLVLHIDGDNLTNDLARGIPLKTDGVEEKVNSWGVSYVLDGNSSIGITDTDNSLDLVGDFTIEFQVKPTAVSNGILIGKSGEGTYPKPLTIGYGIKPTHYGYWYGYSGGTSGSTCLDLNQWKKVYIIAHGEELVVQVGEYQLYSGYFNQSDPDFLQQLNDLSLKFGEGFATAPGQWGSQFFIGEIAKIKMYNRALDISELDPLEKDDQTDYPPNPPIDVTLVDIQGQVKISWNSYCDEDLLAFKIYKSLDEFASVIEEIEVEPNNREYTDPVMYANVENYYRVTAIGHSGKESDYLPAVSITPSGPATFDVDFASDKTVFFGYDPLACVTITPDFDPIYPPYTFEWSTGETTESITVCPEDDLGMKLLTDYSVVITDGRGATGTASIVVNIVDVRCGKKMDKVLLCVNGNNPHTICVSPKAVAAHLANGATFGDCGEGKPVGFGFGELDFIVYPNPSNGSFTIQGTLITDNRTNIEVRNVLGQIVHFEEIDSAEGAFIHRIELKSVKAGMYFLRLSNGSEVIRKSIIVE